MSNLEKLGLFLSIYVEERFFDGNHLKQNILYPMSQLKQLTFDIRSVMYIRNVINLPSKEDIQRTFIGFHYPDIVSCVDYFRERESAQCHVYSYPCLMPYYDDITNNFPGGFFPCVRVVSLYDEVPFEHEFFMRIVRSFPFMENLSLMNRKSQNHKQFSESISQNQHISIVEYCYLTELDMDQVHDDYIEEFLLYSKTSFKNNILLHVDYKSLERVTHNFTREDTRMNCAKIKEMFLSGQKKYSKSIEDYFPFAKIH